MAAALLGKCISLLALAVLFYTCCHAFRIRDVGPQPPVGGEQTHRGTCASIFGRCTVERTTTTATTTSVPRKWHETAATRPATARKPPVEVTSPRDDDGGSEEEGLRTRSEKAGHSRDGFGGVHAPRGSRTKSAEAEDEDDDEEDAIVEVEDESDEEVVEVSDEQVAGDSGTDDESGANEADDEEDERDDEEDEEDEGGEEDDDEDEEEEEKSIERRAKVRRKNIRDEDDEDDEDDDDDDDEDKDVRRDAGKSFLGSIEKVKPSTKKEERIISKTSKIGKPTKYQRAEDEGDEEEEEKSKKVVAEKGSKDVVKRPVLKKQDKTKAIKEGKSDEDDEKDNEDNEDDEDDEDDDDSNAEDDDKKDSKDDMDEEDEKDDEDDEDEDEDEKDESIKPKVVPTSPPRKLEKVRLADKDKPRPMEMISTTPIPEKPKVEPKKKSAETTKKQEVTAKETTKKVAEVTKKSAEAPKKPPEATGKSVETSKKVESHQTAKPETETPKSKPTSKPGDKAKAPVKQEVPKTPPKSKEQPKESKKTKVKKVEVDAAPAKVVEVPRSDKKESKSKAKRSAEAPITLAELNDAILHVPTFVPNFTAVEDPECQQHGKIFLRQLRGYKLWALQMLDSSAKIPSGLLRGNVNQLGDFDECLGVLAHVKIDEKTVRVQGKYCLASIDMHATHPDMKLPVNLMQARAFIRGSMRDPGHFVPKFTTVNWALCLPAACSAEDAETVLEHALEEYNTTTGVKFTVNVDPDMCYIRQKSRTYSKETIGVLYFYAMIFCLVAIATVRDYFVVSEGKGNYSERIIMSFSLRRNFKALLKEGTSKSDITCIHGIRALVTIALYVAHQLVPISRLPFSNRVYLTEVANHPISSLLRVSMVYTDAFLLLSGVLSAYNMAQEFTTRGEIRWFCRFIARYIRLTPALLVVIFWYAFIMEHVGSGPQWNSAIVANAELCKNNAWTNLLYVQNFFPFEEMCATHTHQLALDMQLSLLAPTLVFFLQCKPIIGILLISFFVLLSATLRYMATMGNYLSLVIFHGMSLKHLYKTANLSYALPLHRATPYVFGVGLGVLLHYTGKNVRIHKVLVILGWLIAMALGSWSLFSPWRLAKRDYVYDAEEATHYAVISPVLWALALCWFIFASFTNNGGIINRFLSNYWLVIFSRISYAVYLTQFAVFFYNVGTTRYSTEFQLHRAIDPLEALAVLTVSIALTLLFDLPMQEIKTVIMEITDGLAVEGPAEEKSADQDTEKAEKTIKEEEVHEKVFEEDEIASTGWDWQKDIVEGGVKPGTEVVEDEELVNVPILKKTDGRRQSFIAHDTYEEEAMPTWDWIKGPNRRLPKENVDDERIERGRRSRNGQRDYPEDSEDETLESSRIQQEREEALKRSRRSLSRGLDNKRLSTRESEDEEEYQRRREDEKESRQYRRSESRGRSVARDAEDYRSWEFIGRERSSSRGPETKRASNKPEEYEFTGKQQRPPLTRTTEARRILSSESEDEPSVQRTRLEKKHVLVEPRISDEEEWENELRIRRKQFMEKFGVEEKDSLEEEEEDLTSVRRRSSAEGRIALLKDPSGDDNMDSWTVSVGPRIAQLGSSQEPSEPEDDNAYARRREYRERAPPVREEVQSEEETTWDSSRRRSYTSGSQVTSLEEDDASDYNFVLTKDSKRISVQDLSKLSQEESDLADSGWNVVKKEGSDSLLKTTSLGLYKRESIVKSQASEEDPEYLLPERPKLVQQEREHPFKKAWQMQKSRSEDDGSSAYAIKETKEQPPETKSKDEDAAPVKRELSGEQSEDVGSLADDESESATLSHSRSSDTESNVITSKSDETESASGNSRKVEEGGNAISEVDEEPLEFNWPDGDQQSETYSTGLRRKSEETEWNWEQEET